MYGHKIVVPISLYKPRILIQYAARIPTKADILSYQEMSGIPDWHGLRSALSGITFLHMKLRAL